MCNLRPDCDEVLREAVTLSRVANFIDSTPFFRNAEFVDRILRTAAGVTGTILVAQGLMRRSRLSTLCLLTGAELIRLAATGRFLWTSLGVPQTENEDRVDLGSELSFPASDPPAY